MRQSLLTALRRTVQQFPQGASVHVSSSSPIKHRQNESRVPSLSSTCPLRDISTNTSSAQSLESLCSGSPELPLCPAMMLRFCSNSHEYRKSTKAKKMKMGPCKADQFTEQQYQMARKYNLGTLPCTHQPNTDIFFSVWTPTTTHSYCCPVSSVVNLRTVLQISL